MALYSSKKKVTTFGIHPEVLLKLKVYSLQHAVPYGTILEALADTFLQDPSIFPSIEFKEYS
jgi:hypothetical protein